MQGEDTPKLCECGCGEPAPIAGVTHRKRGYVKGQPCRFIPGHNNRARVVPIEERVWRYVARTDHGCWEWTGSTNASGYGQIGAPAPAPGGRRNVRAHRLVYELLVGPIPEGLQLDHLCSNRRCVNPDHLEPVTNAENARRGMRSKLSYDAAQTIRASTEQTHVLAKRYGVERTTIKSIRAGKSWTREASVGTGRAIS